ncbi:MAG: hypothetical protein M1282_14620, partial [Chloroflexi bacterium]|nr:hypothetical protein [Chloroflexota bacterium]
KEGSSSTIRIVSGICREYTIKKYRDVNGLLRAGHMKQIYKKDYVFASRCSSRRHLHLAQVQVSNPHHNLGD